MSGFLLWVAVTPLCFFAYCAAFLHGAGRQQGVRSRRVSYGLPCASFGRMYLAMLLVAWFA